MTQTQHDILAMLRNASRKTKPIVVRTDAAKVSVLAATGRPATLPEQEAVRVGAIPLIDALRKAAQ